MSPSILIIPGSFAQAPLYFPLQASLATLSPSTKTYVSNLPSASRNAPESPASLDDDAAHFASLITTLADRGEDVILLAHSYGGVVATHTLGTHGASVLKSQREKEGKAGGVVRVVFLASHVPSDAKSLGEMVGPPPEGMVTLGEDGFLSFAALEMIASANFPELHPTSPQRALDFTNAYFGRHSAISFQNPVTHPDWTAVAVSWILPELDFIVPVDVQKGYVAMIGEKKGHDVTVHEVKGAGHCVNLTKPDEVAAILKGIVEGGN